MQRSNVEIRSKRSFYRRWIAGELGNRTQIFYTLQEAMKSGVEKIGFRELNRSGGGGAWERADRREQVPEIHARWVAAGRQFLMDDGVPNDKTVLQGELVRTERGLRGYLAIRPEGELLPPMRISMARGMHREYSPLQVRLLLEKFMDPASRDDVDLLLDLYPDHVIEFACFEANVGNIPGRNTMIWEVRAY